MHTAHNAAYAVIDTELNTCIDSDDALAPGAVEAIVNQWNVVREKGYAGLIALDSDFSGQLIGSGFPADLAETTLTGYYAAGGTGDKKLIYRTDVIRSVPPYPEYPGEKYVALAYKYRLIDQMHTLSVLPRVVCLVDYQPDGHSRGMYREYLRSPRGFALWRKTCMQYPQSRKRLILDCIHYCSSSQIAKNPSFIRESPRKLLTVLCIPMGWLLTLWIRFKAVH